MKLLLKAQIKAHERGTPSGGRTWVKEHEDSRGRPQEIAGKWASVSHQQAGADAPQTHTFEGGFMHDPESNEVHWVKRGADDDQTRVEHLSNRLYRKMGVKVAPTKLVTHNGKLHVASKVVPGAQKVNPGSLPGHPDVHRGFVQDAYLGAYDVAGMNHSNLLRDKDGGVVRIDQGGSLHRRAQGKVKGPDQWGPEVKEIASMLDPNINALTAKMFSKMKPEEVLDGIKRVTALSNEEIKAEVAKAGLSEKTAETLIWRREDLRHKGRAMERAMAAEGAKSPSTQAPVQKSGALLMLIRKSHVKQHERTGPGGQKVQVREYEDSRTKKQFSPSGEKGRSSEKGQKRDTYEPTPGGGIKLKGYTGGSALDDVGGAGSSLWDDLTASKKVPDLHQMSPEDRALFFAGMAGNDKARQDTYSRIRDLSKIEGVEVHRRDPKAKWKEPDWKTIGKTNPDLVEPPFEALADPGPEPKGKKAAMAAAEAGDEGDPTAWQPMAKKASAGSLIVEPDGRVWVVEPRHHFGGYQHTYPKGGIEHGMSPQETAIKEAMEEAGLEIEILGHLGDYDGVATSTRYYVAKRMGGDPTQFKPDETHAVKLVPPEHLDKFLNVARDTNIAKDFKEKYEQAMAAGKGDLKAGWATLPPWEPKVKEEKPAGGARGPDGKPWELRGHKGGEGDVTQYGSPAPKKAGKGGFFNVKDLMARAAEKAKGGKKGVNKFEPSEKMKAASPAWSLGKEGGKPSGDMPGESLKEKLLRMMMFKSSQRVKGHQRTLSSGRQVYVPDYWRSAIARVKAGLSSDLLHANYRAAGKGSPDPETAGHCYAASEALYHLGAKEEGYAPHHMIHEGQSHWFLKDVEGRVLDPTASQFSAPPAYHQGVRRGFLTKEPSKRTAKLIQRMAINPNDHKAIVEAAGGIFNATTPHPARPGYTWVYVTEPRTGSTGVVTLEPEESLSFQKVAQKLRDIRLRFGLTKSHSAQCFTIHDHRYEDLDPRARAARHPIQRLDFQGLPVSIENRVGSIRSWYDPMKEESGHTRMHHRYGYIRGTVGADGDQLDCFIGPDHSAPMAYVVRQVHPETRRFDEHKVMLGFPDEESARLAYLRHYNDPRFFGSIHAMPMDALHRQLRSES